jgi:hypothetical protein
MAGFAPESGRPSRGAPSLWTPAGRRSQPRHRNGNDGERVGSDGNRRHAACTASRDNVP